MSLVALIVGFVLVGALGMFGLVWRAGLLGHGGAHPSQTGSAAARPTAAPSVNVDPAPPTELVSNAPLAQVDPIDSRSGAEESPVPPLASAHPAASSLGTSSLASSTRIVLDASNARPGIGQPVDFVARVVGGSAGRTKIDSARFRIAGPGLASATDLPVADDGSGAFHTTFTFLEAGRFDILFSARADGAMTNVSRVVVVGEPSAASPPHGAAASPEPQPSGKWL